ncbi:unnamed protein product [Nezara viridula]|uniref:Uncharacterized protein n=1 Tax=Nezara viridula TaxID=85310 RepID=A0A9P0MVZ7_NEZVI|nr:unnamed protein product [Nezara viridula]
MQLKTGSPLRHFAHLGGLGLFPGSFGCRRHLNLKLAPIRRPRNLDPIHNLVQLNIRYVLHLLPLPPETGGCPRIHISPANCPKRKRVTRHIPEYPRPYKYFRISAAL